MAIATPSMSNNKDEDEDHHEHDMVMPGFRFHPTEEELVEFYLRRKVEGKRFNVELITFLDLYRYDPWELPGNYKKIKYKLSLFHKARLYPYIYIIFIFFLLHRLTACHGDPLLNSTRTSSLSAFPPFMHGGNSRPRHLLPGQLSSLAAIGEKEWFFYVPRDRKYRNGDRPNRVTTSGYWKATGADRMIKSESSRSIGLKKTLVFYSGKAPKGIRTSWIMNEYRLPHHETERYQKAEISLCRVYKRAGVEDHPSLPRSLPTRASSSSSSRSFTPSSNAYPQEAAQHLAMERTFQTFGNQSRNSPQLDMEKMSETDGSTSSDVTTVLGLSKQNLYRPTMSPAPISTDGLFLDQSKQVCNSLVPTCTTALDEFHGLLTYQQQPPPYNFNQPSQFSTLQHHQVQAAPLGLNILTSSLPISDRLWEWNPVPEANRDYNDPFK